jgi:hypothetical protein
MGVVCEKGPFRHGRNYTILETRNKLRMLPLDPAPSTEARLGRGSKTNVKHS